MKITARLTLFLCFISPLSFSLAAEFPKTAGRLPEPFLVVPEPQKAELLPGEGLEFGQLKKLALVGEFNRPVMGPLLSRLPLSGPSDSGILTLKLESGASAPESREGYGLSISGGNAEIVSRGEAGLFYGCQTLEQLLEDGRDLNKAVPALKITDSPALAYRAVHFDVKHHLDRMNYYYESIDRLARYKINAVVFEFEDKLRYKRQPLVGAPQSISIDEMAALTRYARERHIEITPLVQGLGHATFILKHQHYAHLRELSYNRWAFCPLNEGTYQVLFDLYRDAIEATPGATYLHIGGDEIGNIGLCPRCKPTADKQGMAELNLYWLKRVCEFAKENGRIPIFWDDMPLKHAGVHESTRNKEMTPEQAAKAWEVGEPKLDQSLSDFPTNCVYMRWNYTMARQPGNIRALEWYRKHKLKAMIATATQATIAEGIPAIQSFIQLAAAKEIDGMLCTAWDDTSPHMENYWRGFIASAEFSWAPTKRTLAEYDIAYLQRDHGTTMPDYAALHDKLKKTAEFWDKSYERKGHRKEMANALFNMTRLAHSLPPEDPSKAVLRTNFTDILIELPELRTPGSWSQKYANRLDEAALIAEYYQSTSKALKALNDSARKNRYHWEVLSAVNALHATAPHLLLALKQCDTADKTQQKAGLGQVRAALREFDEAWNNVQSVYSQTRFVSNPEGYVPDRYMHFASQREDLTWMIQAEELFHQMLNQWISKNQLQ